MTGLLSSEQISSPADFHVGRRDAKSGSQGREVLNRLQALLRLPRQGLFFGNQQVGIGLMTGAADPPAQLIQLSQAEGVGPSQKDRIGSGDIETGSARRLGQQRGRL